MVKINYKKELKNLYSSSAKKVEVVEVPQMNFLMVAGEGDPNTSQSFQDAIDVLYPLSYTLKFIIKRGQIGIDYGVLPLEKDRPPSGAYALQEALRGGHDRVEVFGFDSIAGVFSTTSQITYNKHDTDDKKMIEDRMDKWITFYKTVTEHYNGIEIIWHTKKD